MPRIRTIKPEIWTSEDFMALTSIGKNAFVALITQADDEGRQKTTAAHLDAICLRTGAVEEVQGQLDQMEDQEMIRQYRVGRLVFVWLVNWDKHQKVQHPTPSTYPAPDDPQATPLRESSGRLVSAPEASSQDVKAPETAGAFHPSRGRADRIGPDQYQDQEDPPTPQGEGVASVAGEYGEWLAELNQATGRSFRGCSASRKRYRVLRREGVSAADLLAAARGVAISPFHRGENDRHVPYQDPITVLRSRQLATLIDLGRGAIQPMVPGAALPRHAIPAEDSAAAHAWMGRSGAVQ